MTAAAVFRSHKRRERAWVDCRHGVIDLSGRVHGATNVCVADASLFPSACGVAPVTIMAFARLIATRGRVVTLRETCIELLSVDVVFRWHRKKRADECDCPRLAVLRRRLPPAWSASCASAVEFALRVPLVGTLVVVTQLLACRPALGCCWRRRHSAPAGRACGGTGGAHDRRDAAPSHQPPRVGHDVGAGDGVQPVRHAPRSLHRRRRRAFSR